MVQPGSARRRGIAMLLVMISVAIVGVLTLSFLTAQSTSTAIASNVEAHAEARGVAESGLSYAVAYLREHEPWRDDLTPGQWIENVAIAGGRVRLKFDDETGDFTDDTAEPVLVTAVGEAGGVTHRVEARVVPTPNEAVEVLLVVSDDDLNERDAAKKALFESWGMVVTPLDDHATTAQLLEAANGVDVVYISETIHSTRIDTKLTGHGVGIVCEEGHLADALELNAWNAGTSWGDDIDLVDASHPITSGFAAGGFALFGSSTSLRQYGGLAPGVDVLAEKWGVPLLAVAEKGATLDDGSLAAGRRVLTPWGHNEFKVSHLTDDGRALVESALRWAAAEPAVVSGLIAEWHFNTGDPGSVDHVDWSDTPDAVTQVPDVNFGGPTTQALLPGGPDDHFALRLTGSIQAPQPGAWEFRLTSNDGSALALAGDRVIDNDGDHATESETGSASLGDDPLPFELLYYEHMGSASLDLEWRGPGVSEWTLVPASAFNAVQPTEPEEPRLLALYEFQRVEVTPRLIGRWSFDQLTSSNQRTPIQVAAGDRIDLPRDSLIDSYSSLNGPYGGSNAGQAASIGGNAEYFGAITLDDGTTFAGDVRVAPGADPDHVVTTYGSAEVTGTLGNLDQLIDVSDPADPTGYPPSSGDRKDEDAEAEIGADGEDTLLAYDDWDLEDSTLTIRGNVGIDVQDDFRIENSEIRLAPGATLRLYCGAIAYVINSRINPDPGRSQDFTFINYGSGVDQDMRLYEGTVIAGAIRSADDVEFQAGVTLYGTVFAEDDLKRIGGGSGGAAIHADVTLGLAGDTFADATDTSHAHTAGGVTVDTGHSNAAAAFDGVDDHIEIPHHESHRLDEGSVSFWFYAEDLGGRQGLVTKDAAGRGDGGHLRVYLDGPRLHFQLAGEHDEDTLVHPGSVEARRWHHAVAAWGPEGMRLYLDDAEPMTRTDRTHGLAGNDEPWVLAADALESTPGSPLPLRDHFHGRLDELRLYDRRLTTDQVATVRQDLAPGPALSMIVKDTAGYGDPLDLIVDNPAGVTWTAGGGLDVTGDVRIASAGPAGKLYTALTATDQLTVEAVFVPDNLTQDGPARIVSMSEGTSRRNFTLGQDEDDYDFRLRTTASSSNGTPEAEAGAALATDQTQHVIVSFNAEGELVLRRNGAVDRTVADFGGTFAGWDGDMGLILANEFESPRPWRGRLSRIAIYDRGVDRVQAERMFNGSPPGLPGSQEDVSLDFVWIEGP